MKEQTLAQKTIASVTALTLACSMVAIAPASAAAAEKKTAKKPPATKVAKLTRTQTTLTVKWKKVAASKTDGYEVRYATNAKMAKAKKIKVTKAKTTATTIKKGIKPATTYYVQVRTYKKVGKKTQTSAWSAMKSITTRVKTGDKSLDKSISTILDKNVKKTGEVGLKQAFDYVVKMPYKSLGSTSPKGKWSVGGAKKMIKNKGGNCYESAALFCWLAKGLGYDAKVVSGKTSGRAHGWVEVKLGGKTYICDPNSTWRITSQKNSNVSQQLVERGYDLGSCLFMKTYDEAPFAYSK